MNVLFLSGDCSTGECGAGIGSLTSHVAQVLASDGYAVTVLSCVRDQEASDEYVNGVTVHKRPFVRVPGLDRVVKSRVLSDRIRSSISFWVHAGRLGLHPDVIEAPDWMADGLLFALARSPVVTHLHAPFKIAAQAEDRTWVPRMIDLLERWAVSRARAVTSPSRRLAANLTALGWLRRPVEIIPNPVDVDSLRHVCPVTQTEPVILAVGRLEPGWAPELVIHAARRLQSEGIQLKIIFVGRSYGNVDGRSYQTFVQEEASRLDVPCEFAESSPCGELPRWFEEARVVAVPSSYETFSMVPLEAAASGRPVVLCEGIGAAEVLEGSESGATFPPGNAEGLASALRPFLRNIDAAATAGANGYNAIANSCGPRIVAKRRAVVYEGATARPKSFSDAAPLVHELAPDWAGWATEQVFAAPWKHFYLATAEQLISLLMQHPNFSTPECIAGASIVDIGCTPAVSVLLAALGAHVTMLDLAPAELTKAIQASRQLGVVDRVSVVRADAFRAPFRSRSFDVAWNCGFIEHFPDPSRVIVGMAQLVKTGGGLSILTPGRWTPHTVAVRPILRRQSGGFYWDFMGKEKSFSASQLKGMLRRAGCRPVGSDTRNLRRSVLDDYLILPKLDRLVGRRNLLAMVGALDRWERRFSFLRRFGFMAGAIGVVDRASDP